MNRKRGQTSNFVVLAKFAVPVKALAGSKPSFEDGTPVALFDAHIVPSVNNNVFEYDVTADGKRFLIDAPGASDAASPPLTVVTNCNAGTRKPS